MGRRPHRERREPDGLLLGRLVVAIAVDRMHAVELEVVYSLTLGFGP